MVTLLHERHSKVLLDHLICGRIGEALHIAVRYGQQNVLKLRILFYLFDIKPNIHAFLSMQVSFMALVPLLVR